MSLEELQLDLGKHTLQKQEVEIDEINDGIFNYSDEEVFESPTDPETFNPELTSNDLEKELIDRYSAEVGERYIESIEIENIQRKNQILSKIGRLENDGNLEIYDEIPKELKTSAPKEANIILTKSEDYTEETDEKLTPPENFSPVIGEIYRSSFPRYENFKFLQRLGLKSILILIPEDYPQENLEFVKDANINIFQVGLSGNKEPFVKIPHDLLTRALEIALNPANHPLLIHCNRGKHRTGCLVGCIRRLQKWSLTMILDEYRRFAAPKIRPLDQQFIEMYNEDEIEEIARKKGWLPLKW